MDSVKMARTLIRLQPAVLVVCAVALLCLEAHLRSQSSSPSGLLQLEQRNQQLFDLDGPSPQDPPRSAWKRAGHGTSAWMESRPWKNSLANKHPSNRAKSMAHHIKSFRGKQVLAQVEDAEYNDGLLKGRPDYAPSSNKLGAGFGYRYSGGLPPDEWPRNFDGENFVTTNGDNALGSFVVEEPHMDGAFWLAASGADPASWYPPEEDAVNVFQDMSWNENAWCGAVMCDITTEDPVTPPNGDFAPGVPFTAY